MCNDILFRDTVQKSTWILDHNFIRIMLYIYSTHTLIVPVRHRI